MAGALTLRIGVFGQGGIEVHHGFRIERAVLGRTERQNVDTGAPRRLSRRTAERGDGVGEPRPIHVDPEPAVMGGCGEARDVVDAIDRAPFRHLGQAERRVVGVREFLEGMV